MENPNTWNDLVKKVNSSIYNIEDCTVESIIKLLKDNSFLLKSETDTDVNLTIASAITQWKFQIENKMCGNSFGQMLYLKLKNINAVE